MPEDEIDERQDAMSVSDDTVGNYMDYIRWVYEFPESRYAFRGQANVDWELTTGAYRRLRENIEHPEEIDSIFVKYLHERIDQAYMRFSEYRDMKPLEVMAKMQHYGAATCLIDFTKSALIALWFACKEEFEHDGEVFAIHLDGSDEVEEAHIRKDIGGKLEQFFPISEPLKQLYFWECGDDDVRMVVQQSLFIFGRPKIEASSVKTFSVPCSKKKQLLRLLKKIGITEDILFPDFFGFSSVNAVRKDYKIEHARK